MAYSGDYAYGRVQEALERQAEVRWLKELWKLRPGQRRTLADVLTELIDGLNDGTVGLEDKRTEEK